MRWIILHARDLARFSCIFTLPKWTRLLRHTVIMLYHDRCWRCLYQLFTITKPYNYQGWYHRSSSIYNFPYFFRSEAPLWKGLSFTQAVTHSVTPSDIGVTFFLAQNWRKNNYFVLWTVFASTQLGLVFRILDY